MFKIENKSFYRLLQKFVDIPAVSGFENDIENYIGTYCDKKNIANIIFPGFGICVGNPNSKNYVFAHTDEVGGIITEVGDIIKFEGIGRVKPSMFVGRDIEIISENKKIPAIVVGNIPLKIDYENFSDLQIIVGENDKKFLKPGLSLRYKANYLENSDSIFSTSLDNRISIAVLIYLLDYFLEDLKNGNICFCFAGEEEIKNKGALFFMNKFKPQKFIIPDVFPISFLGEKILPNKNIVLEKTLDYQLDKDIEKIISNKEFLFINSNLDLLKRSEVSQYEKINFGKGISVGIPVFNYHNGTYFIKKDLINKFVEDIYFLIKNIF